MERAVSVSLPSASLAGIGGRAVFFPKAPLFFPVSPFPLYLPAISAFKNVMSCA